MSGLRKRRAISCMAAAIASMALVSPAAAGASCGADYVETPGDTLSKIAARCGSSVEVLMHANPRITSPAEIAVGWRLSIPQGVSLEVGAESDEERRDQQVELTGRIVNGRRCAMIETAEGEAYGLVSPELAFVNGAVVAVTGHVVDDPSCTGPRTLLVHELTKPEPT
jgi:hypothetical protein